MTELKTEAEFIDLLPLLSNEEKSKLENSIRETGCRDPLVVWQEQGIILDGHNRYEICKRLGVDFNTKMLSFPGRDEAKLWMLKTQLGRRNLNAFHRTRAQLMIANLEKNLGSSGVKSDLGMSKPADGHEPSKAETIEQIARTSGVSPDTVRKVSYLEENIDDEVRKKLMSGETSVSKEYAALRQKDKKEPIPLPEAAMPVITKKEAVGFLTELYNKEEKFDLLITEPPSYQEWQKNGSLNDYVDFTRQWLGSALSVLKVDARAFIFVDTDIFVLNRLLTLAIEQSNANIEFSDLLIWTYRPQENDAGKEFNANWQGILYFRGKQALAKEKSTELNTVLHFMKDFHNDFKYKDWRKPVPLVRKLIQFAAHGGKVLDPFAGSGQFLLTAARAGYAA
ncbi:MAG: DNA modification methylase, partial [Leptospiraceae bacterium]|nr:DNA modification methylase [Leptospiraceae bacterium]